MCDLTDVSGCDARTTCCMSSRTSDAAVGAGTATAPAAVALHYTIDTDSTNAAAVVIVNGSKSIAVSAANSATDAEVCNSINTTFSQSSASLDVLQTPTGVVSPVTETVNSVSSLSAQEPTKAGSPFCFSVPGYNFQKYTNMVTVTCLVPYFLY